MKGRIHIHTIIDKSAYKKLQTCGNGLLNDGIHKCIEVAEARERNVKIILERIARKVLNEYAETE